ncbi:ABC transporter ATP-binding protein [Scopulibacillus cellulosilyticus]|uniref:ATP-binding cassette domain-containing protein n=1 Tax=Scopulibacillus cellulosilyticus TaxID=2665665 RepID=A0ABW2PRM4_9BACL
MFTLKGVRFKQIINIPSLEIPDAKITGIVGESGSGKSTLLKLLNHLTSYDEGTIELNGKAIEQYDPVELRRQVVMLPQTPVLYAKTVKDNLLIGLHFSEKPPVSDQELKRMLEVVHLDKALEDNAETLSGGEKQRLALARVLLMDPPVFLLDEPTSALDEGLEDAVMNGFFNTIKERCKTVVMVTHSLNMARRYCDVLVNIRPFTMKGDEHE